MPFVGHVGPLEYLYSYLLPLEDVPLNLELLYSINFRSETVWISFEQHEMFEITY